MRVVVVGNLSLDRVDGAPPRPGGPPFYAARALTALGVPAAIRVKCRDSDRSRFAELGAFTLPVEWYPATATATYAFSYAGELRSMEVVELGDPWSPTEVAGISAPWIHVGALYRGEFPEQTLAAIARTEARISLDGQGLVRPARVGQLVLEPEPDLALLRYVSVLKLSEEEAQALVGRLDERALSELGVPEVLVTLGSRGSLVVARRRLVHVPADPVDGVDPTGAGDAFAAAYVVARDQGQAPRRAAERATRAVRSLLAR